MAIIIGTGITISILMARSIRSKALASRQALMDGIYSPCGYVIRDLPFKERIEITTISSYKDELIMQYSLDADNNLWPAGSYDVENIIGRHISLSIDNIKTEYNHTIIHPIQASRIYDDHQVIYARFNPDIPVYQLVDIYGHIKGIHHDKGKLINHITTYTYDIPFYIFCVSFIISIIYLMKE